MEEPTRRCVLGGLGAGLAELLFQTQLKAASSLVVQTGKPGKLNPEPYGTDAARLEDQHRAGRREAAVQGTGSRRESA